MALGGKVVNLVGLYALHHHQQAGAIGHICKMQMKMRMALKVGYPLTVINAASANAAMHVVTFFKQ